LAAIHNAIGEIHSQRGQVNLSVHYYQRALELETRPEERGAIKARMGRVYASAGDGRGLPLIEEALQELNPETQANVVALATAMIGRYYHYRAIHSKAIEYLERARSIAEPLDDAETLSEVYAFLAGAYQHLTRYPESMAWARKNIALGQRKNHPISEAYGYEFLAEDSAALGEWKNSLEYGERDREIGKRIGAQDRIAWGTFAQASARHGLGELASAERDARAVRSLSENIGDIRLASFSGGLLVQILGDLGQEEEANALVEQVLREADAQQHVYNQLDAWHCCAYFFLHQNQVEKALELYTQVEELMKSTDNLRTAITSRPWLAQAYLDTGQVE
ncbi:MAG TPA: hypothetical protein VN648_26920, partial [Candidatus Methylomirabilis sp.]|nr:hypothetical protein [Candidatus Methylomirabilis sp.]